MANLPAVLKLCTFSLEQLAARMQPNTSDSASCEDITGAVQAEGRISHNKKILEQKEATLKQWLSKVQGTSEKILASMLWEDTDEV